MTQHGAPAIGEHGIIGDCRTAALVANDGTIDWLCMPRFDSPSSFAALLDPRRGGGFGIRPTGRYDSTQTYLGHSNVLCTTFTADGGVVRVVDCMPVYEEQDRAGFLEPDHEVLRVVQVVSGEVEVEVVFDPRPLYGRITPTLEDRGHQGIFCQHMGQVLALRSEIPVRIGGERPGARGTERLVAGQQRVVAMSFTHDEPVVIPALGGRSQEVLQRTLRWWERWASRCEYDGPFREDVVRSALTLKLMCYAPSGAVVAAPTTSLPESLGGVRNWDYRYCWLRDASMTLRALFELGYRTEAEAFLGWLMHATSRRAKNIRVLYDIYGASRIEEGTLDHLDGYRDSRPVRVGNAASTQLQLDTYGELVEAMYDFVIRGGSLSRASRRLLEGVGRFVRQHWREPDQGIWEIRSSPQHHTYSKVMCWVALDRILRLQDKGVLSGDGDGMRADRESIRRSVDRDGWSDSLRSYVQVYGGDRMDASLLMLSRYGYLPGSDERMKATRRRIAEQLQVDGLVYRYGRDSDDGLPGHEGAFGICSFWMIEALALEGEVDTAARTFEDVCGRSNELGLFSEEIDPQSGELLGNFPQAFTHVGLINAALTVSEQLGERPVREDKPDETREAV